MGMRLWHAALACSRWQAACEGDVASYHGCVTGLVCLAAILCVLCASLCKGGWGQHLLLRHMQRPQNQTLGSAEDGPPAAQAAGGGLRGLDRLRHQPPRTARQRAGAWRAARVGARLYSLLPGRERWLPPTADRDCTSCSLPALRRVHSAVAPGCRHARARHARACAGGCVRGLLWLGAACAVAERHPGHYGLRADGLHAVHVCQPPKLYI